MVELTFALLAAASRALASASVSAFWRSSRFCIKDPVAATSSSLDAIPSPRFAASASIILLNSERYVMAALEVYFFSIFWFMLEWPCVRKYCRALAFPPNRMASIWRCVHSSKSTLRTNVVCTPMDRCVAEQSRQRKIPYVTDAHVGRVAGQSKHTWLLEIALSFLNCKFLSLDDMQTCPFPAAVTVPSFRRFPELEWLNCLDMMALVWSTL
mmetsp:Transcript_14660/g.41521  ORF Transcript_14660/g.41521 Transcript_14660/m.41521 type:complete len:212 (-) Transcript_14660:61-696(-)